MCFDVSIPIRLICSTDGLLCLRSATTSVWHARCRRGPSTPAARRGRGAPPAVRRNPVADCPPTSAARAGMRNQRRQTLQAATAEVRLGPAESARFSGSVASNEALLPLYRPRVRFTIAQTCQRGDFGHVIAENRANVG